MTYKDIISYRLAEGKTKADLLVAAKLVVEGWMKKQEGFMGWQIHELADGSFMDLVCWKDEECAKKCEKNMSGQGDDANLALDSALSAAWYACYDMQSVKSDKATLVFGT